MSRYEQFQQFRARLNEKILPHVATEAAVLAAHAEMIKAAL